MIGPWGPALTGNGGKASESYARFVCAASVASVGYSERSTEKQVLPWWSSRPRRDGKSPVRVNGIVGAPSQTDTGVRPVTGRTACSHVVLFCPRVVTGRKSRMAKLLCL
jgi:hypothetical protein